MTRRRGKLTEKERKRFARKIERRGRDLFRSEIEPKLTGKEFERIRKLLGERMILKRPMRAVLKNVLTRAQEERLLFRGRALYEKTGNAHFVNMTEDIVSVNARLSEAKPKTKKFKELLRKRNDLLERFNEYIELHKAPKSPRI